MSILWLCGSRKIEKYNRTSRTSDLWCKGNIGGTSGRTQQEKPDHEFKAESDRHLTTRQKKNTLRGSESAESHPYSIDVA